MLYLFIYILTVSIVALLLGFFSFKKKSEKQAVEINALRKRLFEAERMFRLATNNDGSCARMVWEKYVDEYGEW